MEKHSRIYKKAGSVRVGMTEPNPSLGCGNPGQMEAKSGGIQGLGGGVNRLLTTAPLVTAIFAATGKTKLLRQ